MSQQRVFLITGGNKGIGLEAVKLLSAQYPNDVILMGTRDVKNGENAINQSINEKDNMSNVTVIQLDVTDSQSVEIAAKEIALKYGHVNVLINNSGIASVDERSVAEGVMNVNVLGLERMNDTFLPLMKVNQSINQSTNQSTNQSINQSINQNKPLIIVVSSEVGTWFPYSATDEKLKKLILSPNDWTPNTAKMLVDDYLNSMPSPNQSTNQSTDQSIDQSINQSTSQYSWTTDPSMMFMTYSVSKTLASAYSRYFTAQHPEIRVAVVCPGFCSTALNNFRGTRPALLGGQSIIWPITNEFKNGHFYRDGEELEYVQQPKKH